MENQINWSWRLEYNTNTKKWTAHFSSFNYPCIFNAESKEFTEYKTAFLWFETKLAEFNRGIDDYTRQLKDQNLLLMKQITESRS
jgi:hypothetical protein